MERLYQLRKDFGIDILMNDGKRIMSNDKVKWMY
jgi:hypothetical protein